MREKYEEMKSMYNRETERSLDLNNKLNIAKRVHKFSQPLQFSNVSRFSSSSVVAPEMKNTDGGKYRYFWFLRIFMFAKPEIRYVSKVEEPRIPKKISKNMELSRKGL